MFLPRRRGDSRYNVQQGPVCKDILAFLGVQQKVQQRYNKAGTMEKEEGRTEMGDEGPSRTGQMRDEEFEVNFGGLRWT